MEAFSNIAGLSARVGTPTRGDNLLDLVLSELDTELKCEVKPGISDHESVLGTVNFKIPDLVRRLSASSSITKTLLAFIESCIRVLQLGSGILRHER